MIFLCLLIIVSVLSYTIDWIHYVLILIFALTIIFLAIAALIAIFKDLKKSAFSTSILILLLCIFGITTSLFRPYEPAVIQSENISKNLKYAYKTDQGDRKDLRSFVPFFSKLEERDSIRLNQVKELYTQDKISEPLDRFHAAFIFHHSNNSNDYRIASQLAAEAASSATLKDKYMVQWLKKASFDRYLLSIGKPEKYGTQNKLSIDFE